MREEHAVFIWGASIEEARLYVKEGLGGLARLFADEFGDAEARHAAL